MPSADETGIVAPELVYHPLYQNCATFAKAVSDFALKELGGKLGKTSPRQPLQEALRRFIIELQKLFIYVAIHFPGVKQHFYQYEQDEDKTIPEVAKKTIFLPIDLT